MNSKWHRNLSFIKSGLRIGGSLLLFILSPDIILKVYAVIWGAAEIIGIVEEIRDFR